MPWTDVEISSERLTLRAFADHDKPTIIELRTSRAVTEFLGGPAGPEIAHEIGAATVGQQWGVFCAADGMTNHAIGTVHFDRERGPLEVSYSFLPSRWGEGLAFEAVTTALAWAARELSDDEVIAVTQTANTRSVALLERLGFARESVFIEFDAQQGQFRRALAPTTS